MIDGSFFDGERSAARPARLEIVAPDVVRLAIGEAPGEPGEAHRWEGRLAAIEISERVGRIPRRVTIPGVGVFETRDNDAVDRALAALGRPFELVHWLEARWPIAIASLLAIAVGSFFFVRHGVPAIADLAARTLPTSVDRAIGARTLELLDGRLLHPSELSPERQAELHARFEEMIGYDASEADLAEAAGAAASSHAGTTEAFRERLELRAAPALGPNALALPSGIIVMTDELVGLAEHDDELVAVLAHELGHVHGRHALRRLFQSVSVSALAFALIGDVSSASALFSAVPVLIDAKHSRDFEREADAFAKGWLVGHGIPPFRFDEILCRMERGEGAHDDDGPASVFSDEELGRHERDEEAKATAEPARERPDVDRLSRYLSTHPTTDERARCPRSELPSDHRADVWNDMREEVSRAARDAIDESGSP
ncbi:MAG: M48 family metallopeptidase [Deltaproteobacteria bacterium]|nr:M48 family metallopeptidase [Deltaproteobacteria bacterium]